MEHASPRAEHTSSANAITWHFNDDFNIVVHSVGCQPCKDYSLHFCSSMIEQDVSLHHALISWSTVVSQLAARRATVGELGNVSSSGSWSCVAERMMTSGDR
jgi:hypothetical protein